MEDLTLRIPDIVQNKEQKRLIEFLKFCLTPDEYGKTVIHYIGIEYYPNLNLLFETYLEQEPKEKTMEKEETPPEEISESATQIYDLKSMYGIAKLIKYCLKNPVLKEELEQFTFEAIAYYGRKKPELAFKILLTGFEIEDTESFQDFLAEQIVFTGNYRDFKNS